jgi:hypothetical protein
MTHEHRPDLAAQLAGIAVTRAILTGADADAHQAAADAPCPACAAIAAASLVMAIASTLAGEAMFMSEELRRVFLAAVDAAEAELRSAGN